MFGRGMRAGIDRREQKKAAAGLETELLSKVGKSASLLFWCSSLAAHLPCVALIVTHVGCVQARAAAGIADTAETREYDRERRRLADQYDGFDMRVGAGLLKWRLCRLELLASHTA
jgi:ATP-dependent RNA helicase DDX23/PRP28